MEFKCFAAIDRENVRYTHLVDFRIDEVVNDAELEGYAFDAHCIAMDMTTNFDWITVVIRDNRRILKAIDFDRHHQGSIDVWYEDEISEEIGG